MMMKDIFNFEDVSDLPNDLRFSINKKKKLVTLRDQVLEILRMKDSLTLLEMRIGYFRLHKRTINHSSLSATLYKLRKEGIAVNEGSVWRLV